MLTTSATAESPICKSCQLGPKKSSTATSNSHSQNLQKFTVFENLAPELRLKIWQLAASEPWEIKLYVLSPEWKDKELKKQTRALAMMHACRESRIEGTRFYTICLERGSRIELDKEGKETRGVVFPIKSLVWVNFDIDSFVFKSGHHRSFVDYHHEGFNFRDPVLDFMQHLKMTNSKEPDLNNGLYDISYSCYLLKSLLRREQLKDFTINHKISGIGFRHFVDCPEVEKVRGDILKKCNVVKQAVRWKVHSILTYEGLDKLQRRSQNPSVVTAFEKMIWQREKTVYL